MRALQVVTLLVMSGLVAFGQNTSGTTIVSAVEYELDSSNWKELFAPVAGFRLSYPGTPKWHWSESKTETITTISLYGYVEYTVKIFETTTEPSADGSLNDRYNVVRDRLATSLSLRVRSERDLVSNNREVRHIEFESSAGIVCRALIVERERQIFALVVRSAFWPLDEERQVLATRFLDSFKLEKRSSVVRGAVLGREVSPQSAADSSTGSEPPRKPIMGGVLNGRALQLPRPKYPEVARRARASGTVTVQVTIDEEGRVIAARAISGHPLLVAAAVEAAYQAVFSPTTLEGVKVKVSGVISYNFIAN